MDDSLTTASLPNSAVASPVSRQTRLGRILSFGLISALLVGAFVIWKQRNLTAQHSRATRQEERDRMKGQAPVDTDRNRLEMQMSRLVTTNYGPSPFSRYAANLATEVGEYVVSVRNVLSGDRGQSLFNNTAYRVPIPPLRRFAVSLQVMAKDPVLASRVRDLALNVTAVDDKGMRLEGQSAEQVALFENRMGLARMVEFDAPSEGARFLQHLDGTLRYTRIVPGKEPELVTASFRINAIPLHFGNTIFGRVSTALLDAKEVAAFADSPPVLTGIAVEKWRERFQTPAGAFGEPCRSLLPPNTTSRFYIVDPLSAPEQQTIGNLEAVITPTLLPGGRMDTTLTLHRKGENTPPAAFRLRFWDGEPQILLLPESFSRPDGKRLALRIKLSLDLSPDPLTEPGPETPFPAGMSERGGVITGSVCIQSDPLRRGTAIILAQRVTGGGSPNGLETRVETLLNPEGRWRFANLSPGRYRLRLSEFRQRPCRYVPLLNIADYLDEHYGLKQIAIQNEEQECEVRPGGRTEIKPFRIVAGTQTPKVSPQPFVNGAAVAQ